MRKKFSALSAVTAAVMAFGCFSVTAGAADTSERTSLYTSATLYGLDEHGIKRGFSNVTDITGISAVTYTFKLDESVAKKAIKGDIDFTGTLGTESDTFGKVSHEWSFAPYQLDENGEVVYGDDLLPVTQKELTMEKIMDGYYCITLENPTGFFKDDDTYARIWFDCDSDKYDISLTGVVLSFDDSKIVKDLKNANIALDNSTFIYSGNACKPKATVTYGKNTLKEGTDYTLSYKNNSKAGTATVTASGKGKYKGTVSKTFTINKRSITTASISLTSLTYAYTGKALKPAVTVKLGGKDLTLGSDYILSYSNNTEIGTASVKITGKGNFSGSVTKTFTVIPKATTIKTATALTGGKAKVTWAKNTSGEGYQVIYADNEKFASSSKKVVNGNTKLTAEITSLKKGKTYYFKVRAFKKVDGKYLYGAYSKVMSVKATA